MNVNQLRKAIKVAKAESKVIYIAIPHVRFHVDFNCCKYRIDGTNELLIINDSFLDDTIVLDIHQIMFIETKFKH
nr:MAG TPA: hypothetical protein [Caudoviricetes sp.]